MAKSVICRKCIACGSIKPRDELFRISRDKEGQISYSADKILPGRGAYICRDRKCIEKAKQKNGLNRSFKTRIVSDILDGLSGEC